MKRKHPSRFNDMVSEYEKERHFRDELRKSRRWVKDSLKDEKFEEEQARIFNAN